MTSWAVNATVTFQHGRLERKDAKRRRTVRHAGGWVGRDDDSMPPQIPGINTSVNFERRVYLHFSHGFNLWRQDRLSHPEITIMRLINDFTDREDWQIEVDDFSACREWREEAFTKHFPESSNLWEWCVFELRKKASEYKSRRSVFVLDSASRICKSDRLVRGDFLEKLKLDTLLLELSPWMLPFVFELSPIRIDGRPITLDNFLDSMTIGDLCPRSNWGSDRLNNGDPEYYSGKSQWLATDVKFSEKNGSHTAS
ncbi:hypothetical protein LMH87_010531 [Akanthomyces muscarius]|uniref:Uncharacterized protein n=1 Tax=Akanthomyces muscarius TaxID=2231603 RepID=A0A9W8QDH3_AKAMU|nr:hypothetical protein LMH87_010531 [Akanthomyces muscarius]KAJ4154068.1 hypothetical protein LMH87_010531 [Akanthomyces muscarius]